MARRTRLARSFAPGVDVFLVTSLINVRYLCGFTGSNGALLVRPDGSAVLATDGRYETQAQSEAPEVELVITRRPAVELAQVATADGARVIGIEAHQLTVRDEQRLREVIDTDGQLTDAGELVEQLRTVKDDEELALLRRACAITDDVFAAVLEQIRPGVTEVDISWELRHLMHERSAEPAFDSIVAFGPNSARPHHQPTGRELQRGELVKMDFGAMVDGYHADMTRTVVCGQPADWQRDLHELVRVVQEEARAGVRPGAVPVELNDAVTARIEASGHQVAHGLGHGVGLEIHESPFLVAGSTAARLVDRVAVTVEPGIYLPGRGGVRIEDTVLVGAAGAESLTSSPRELICL